VVRRPQLAAALAAARSAKCAVLVSKLDRLSSDVAFVSGCTSKLRPQDNKKERSGLQSACDELNDKGAFITGE
jgi:hypothetical protein